MNDWKKRNSECPVLTKSGLQNILSQAMLQRQNILHQESFAMFKNITRHFSTKHANYATKKKPQNCVPTEQAELFFTKLATCCHTSSTQSKPLSEIFKECMVESTKLAIINGQIRGFLERKRCPPLF